MNYGPYPSEKFCFIRSSRERGPGHEVAYTPGGRMRNRSSGDSFRIGAAGIPTVIQALGRWTSPAFLRYIQTPWEHLTWIRSHPP